MIPLPRNDKTAPSDMLSPEPPLTIPEALAERERLEKRYEDLLEARYARQERADEIEIEIRKRQSDLAQERLTAGAEGTLTLTPDKAIPDLEAEHEEILAMYGPAQEALTKVEIEFHYLMLRQADTFTAHAESSVDAALALLAEIQGPYREAYAAWQAAKDESSHLIAHHNYARKPYSNTVGRDPDDIPAAMGLPQGCGLPTPGEVFNVVKPLPAEFPKD